MYVPSCHSKRQYKVVGQEEGPSPEPGSQDCSWRILRLAPESFVLDQLGEVSRNQWRALCLAFKCPHRVPQGQHSIGA